MSTQNGCSPATFLIETESRNTLANSEQNMVVMASDGPSPHSPSLRLGLPAPQPSRRHHAQSLLGPSFHDPRAHHVLESHPRASRASLPPRRSAMSRHRLSLCPCTAPLSCSLQHLIKLSFSVLDHLCSNLSESFHPIPLPCALAFLPPSNRDTTTLSPCWAPHFMFRNE